MLIRSQAVIRCLLPASQLLTVLFVPILAQVAETDTETCLSCHEDYDRALAATSHRLTSEFSGSEIVVECRSCHLGAEAHVEDPEVDNIGNPAVALPAETEKTCTACHQPHMQVGVARYDPHFSQDMSCTSCHRIHKPNSSLLVDEDGGFCQPCHVSVVNEFHKRSNHPLTDQTVTCMSCHDLTSWNDVNFGHGANANCYRCHPEQSGPYLYEHEATSSFSTEGSGCISCHQPHGSSNERLLTTTGDLLCLQCHGTPPNHRYKHNGIGSQYSCNECHSDMHGSYVSRAFLDPQLGAKIAGQPGACYCHGVDD